MAIFTVHFYKVFSTTQSLEIHFFLFQTRDFRFLLSRQEVSESGKKQQQPLYETSSASRSSAYTAAAMYSLELDLAAAEVTAATAATVLIHSLHCSSL